MKKLARIFAIKATKRAGRRRSEEIAQVENQKWKLYYECEKAIFKAIQTKAFLKEQRRAKDKGLRAPNQRREISTKSSPLSPHNPFIDKDGLLRVGSRLIYAHIKEDAKTPILLPKEDSNVKSLIRHVHRQEIDASSKHVLNQL